MIIRYRNKPKTLQQLDALIPRIAREKSNLQAMQIYAAQLQKGFSGERRLDYHLSGLPSQFSILNDISLVINEKRFQIDSLVISPYAIFLLEVKNYEGTVTFNTTHRQFIQANGDKLSGYKYPITQVENSKYLLQGWLAKRNLAGLPIYYLIAIAEHSTIFNVIGDERFIQKVVTYVEEIPLRLLGYYEKMSGKYPRRDDLKNKVVSEILNHSEDFNIDVLEKYKIDLNEIRPGVQCPGCGFLGMKRVHRKWICPKCNFNSVDAHRRALHDYVLLFGNKITNQQCREFLKIESRDVANRILHSSHFRIIEGSRRWLYRD